MRSFTYYSPTKIVFGVDAQLQVGAVSYTHLDVYKRQELCVHTIICQGDGHVRLATAKGGLHHVALEKALMARRAQAQHDLANGQNAHGMSSLFLQQMDGKAAHLAFQIDGRYPAFFVLCSVGKDAVALVRQIRHCQLDAVEMCIRDRCWC